tara:strand:+ start:124 stop:978 length:855 start_codon:yes stop_codon:yes gene_type:complete
MTALGIDIGGSSVKAAAMDSGGHWKVASSDPYTSADRAGIQGAIRSCINALEVSKPASVGLCLPGRMNPEQSAIEFSVNLPVLNSWRFEDLIGSVLDGSPDRLRVVSDAAAAGYDFATHAPIEGRTAGISIGTGVGLCVLDRDAMVSIGNKGIGHLGLMDMGRIGNADRVDPCGAVNTLESFVGAASLESWMGDSGLNLDSLTATEPPMVALVRALRVVHAIYLPERIALLGGVGLALRSQLQTIKTLVDDGLTPLACQGWTIDSGTTTHHAARGAAKLGAQSD